MTHQAQTVRPEPAGRTGAFPVPDTRTSRNSEEGDETHHGLTHRRSPDPNQRGEGEHPPFRARKHHPLPDSDTRPPLKGNVMSDFHDLDAAHTAVDAVPAGSVIGESSVPEGGMALVLSADEVVAVFGSKATLIRLLEAALRAVKDTNPTGPVPADYRDEDES